MKIAFIGKMCSGKTWCINYLKSLNSDFFVTRFAKMVKVIANDLSVTLGGLGSILELNLMLPLIAHNLLYSISILTNSIKVFNEKNSS